MVNEDFMEPSLVDSVQGISIPLDPRKVRCAYSLTFETQRLNNMYYKMDSSNICFVSLLQQEDGTTRGLHG